MIEVMGGQSFSYGFKATRKNGSNHVHVDFVEEYPRALTSDAEVRKDKYGNYSCLFMYKHPLDAERERRAINLTLDMLYMKSQKELYDRYVYEWTAMKQVAGPYFTLRYLYELTFSHNVHRNLISKRAKVTPVKLLRVIQARKEISRVISKLEDFNKSNCPYDYSLGRKTPL